MNSQSLPSGLMLVHGDRSESLRDLLVEWMKRYPLDPLENETILVQSNGIAQWLKLALAAPGSEGCGIAAALDIALPARFIWKAYRAVLGASMVPEVSPFDKARLAWRLMRIVPALAGRPGFEPLRRFISEDGDGRKRYQLAGRIADLFEQYQIYRADWLAAWASDEDILSDAKRAPQPLPDEQRWQAALWRALVEDIRADSAGCADDMRALGSRADVHSAFMKHVAGFPADGQRPEGLPRRIVVFGISSLPPQSVEALVALSRWCQVLMCVPNPCAHYWADIVPDKDLLRATRSRQKRREAAPAEPDPHTLHLHAHPLLASWGKQGRDFIGLLDEHDHEHERERYRPRFTGARIDLFDKCDTSTMLRQLQDDVRDLRPLHETREKWSPVDPATDQSIRFHIAHSPQREVEILHDQLLAAFNRDESLRPRDVIVMVPDIERYAPHIQAVFGLHGREDKRHIPFIVADRGQCAADPLVGAFAALLNLPTSRSTVSDLLDLLDVAALRKRFGIAESDVPRLSAWVRGANVRWGLHAQQRTTLDLPQHERCAAPYTWAFGLRRMLVGYAVGHDAPEWNGIEPFGEVGGLDAALIGPLARLLDALDDTWRMLRQPATAPDWCARVRRLRETFFLRVDAADDYTFSRLDNVMQDWLDTCTQAGLDDELPLSVVGEFWLSQLDQSTLAQRFFAGAVTFATLTPMRAIPFRRVCLLGMNDGDYPRTRMPMDFDLMRGNYRPGDRSRREDDRYLLLDAVLSARDHLHVSWVGRSVNDNSEQPPSVLIGQLRDHLSQGWRLVSHASGGHKNLLDAMTVEHRLQPFSAEYFHTGSGSPSAQLFTYAAEWREPQLAAGPCASGHAWLEALEREEPLTLGELSGFLKKPVETFFQRRLNVSLEERDAASIDHEPFELDHLAQWSLQNELIQAQLATSLADPALEAARSQGMAAMRRRGDIVAGGFGDQIGAALLEPMQQLFDDWRHHLARWPVAIAREREIQLPAATRAAAPPLLVDWLGGWRQDGQGNEARVLISTSALVDDRQQYRYARLMEQWVQHLAANLARRATTVVVSKKGTVEFAPLEAGMAAGWLRDLVDLWEQGMRRPLPFAIDTALKWIFESRKAGGDAQAKACEVYEGHAYLKGEVQQSAALRRAYPTYEALVADGLFTGYAQRVFEPLLAALDGGNDAGAGPSTTDMATDRGAAGAEA